MWHLHLDGLSIFFFSRSTFQPVISEKKVQYKNYFKKNCDVIPLLLFIDYQLRPSLNPSSIENISLSIINKGKFYCKVLWQNIVFCLIYQLVFYIILPFGRTIFTFLITFHSSCCATVDLPKAAADTIVKGKYRYFTRLKYCLQSVD